MEKTKQKLLKRHICLKELEKKMNRKKHRKGGTVMEIACTLPLKDTTVTSFIRKKTKRAKHEYQAVNSPGLNPRVQHVTTDYLTSIHNITHRVPVHPFNNRILCRGCYFRG